MVAVSGASGPGALRGRRTALAMNGEEFRRLGYDLVDRIAGFLDHVGKGPVTRGEAPAEIRAALGREALPETGLPAGRALSEAWSLLTEHSLFSAHPRFAGYVISSAAPVGALADLMASALNPNVGAFPLSPMATEMERQSVEWVAELLGYPNGSGGLMVSGGNMANFVGVLAARRAKAAWDVRAAGMRGGGELAIYASPETHTWLHKAADMAGLGTASIRWIGTDGSFRIDIEALREAIAADRARGVTPFLLVGSAGTVSTGAVDPIEAMAAIAREQELWLHIDGAYGAPAAALPGASSDLKAIRLADSLAVDPHKWLYTPLEAGCVLVRDAKALTDAFDYTPPYYRFEHDSEEAPLNYYARGPQNSRGFRALKVWLALRVAGREGIVQAVAKDIALANLFAAELRRHACFEVMAQGLSVVAFRYLTPGLPQEELNALNARLLERIQKSGELFLSNAVLAGRFALRLCLTNLNTTEADILAMVAAVRSMGRELAGE